MMTKLIKFFLLFVLKMQFKRLSPGVKHSIQQKTLSPLNQLKNDDMSKIEKLINWAITIATAVGVAIQYILQHIPS